MVLGGFDLHFTLGNNNLRSTETKVSLKSQFGKIAIRN